MFQCVVLNRARDVIRNTIAIWNPDLHDNNVTNYSHSL
jgi:hypothetical protein